MLTSLAAFALAASLGATPAPAPEPVPAPSLEAPEVCASASAPTPAVVIYPNCWVTCWDEGQTYFTHAFSMGRCGQFGDEKCGVCNWDGYYNGIFFANC